MEEDSTTFSSISVVILSNSCFAVSPRQAGSQCLSTSRLFVVNIIPLMIPATTRTHISPSFSASWSSCQTIASVFLLSISSLSSGCLAPAADPNDSPPLEAEAERSITSSESSPRTLIRARSLIGLAGLWRTCARRLKNFEGDDSPPGSADDKPPDVDPAAMIALDRSGEVKSARSLDSIKLKKTSRSPGECEELMAMFSAVGWW
mmetsp:Transcript_14284/g.31297  ORF Transcript_14284/g.31297 Transcript_14284/m.31297 type:complete len:205 (+) Transcript_14284:3018-3632(+)